MYVEDVKIALLISVFTGTVYTIYVEDVEDVQMYMYLFQEDVWIKTRVGSSWGQIFAPWKLWTERGRAE